jgi:hypothetical protein
VHAMACNCAWRRGRDVAARQRYATFGQFFYVWAPTAKKFQKGTTLGHALHAAWPLQEHALLGMGGSTPGKKNNSRGGCSALWGPSSSGYIRRLTCLAAWCCVPASGTAPLGQ